MQIRPAAPQDAPQAAPLLVSTMGQFGVALLGEDSLQHTEAVMEKLFSRPGNRFNWQVTHLAEVEGTAAGLLASFPGKEISKRELPLLWQIWPANGFLRTLRLTLRGLPAAFTPREALPDEYHIAHLAVSPEFQRRGIGKALLKHAEALASQAGYRKCSLNVEINNNPAQALYEKMGYVVKNAHQFPDKISEKYKIIGFEHRVKDI